MESLPDQFSKDPVPRPLSVSRSNDGMSGSSARVAESAHLIGESLSDHPPSLPNLSGVESEASVQLLTTEFQSMRLEGASLSRKLIENLKTAIADSLENVAVDELRHRLSQSALSNVITRGNKSDRLSSTRRAELYLVAVTNSLPSNLGDNGPREYPQVTSTNDDQSTRRNVHIAAPSPRPVIDTFAPTLFDDLRTQPRVEFIRETQRSQALGTHPRPTPPSHQRTLLEIAEDERPGFLGELYVFSHHQ